MRSPPKIMSPAQVPPVGSIIYYPGVQRSWSVVTEQPPGAFGSALHLCGRDDVFGHRTYSTVGCVHAPDPRDWPDEVCVALAKWQLLNV